MDPEPSTSSGTTQQNIIPWPYLPSNLDPDHYPFKNGDVPPEYPDPRDPAETTADFVYLTQELKAKREFEQNQQPAPLRAAPAVQSVSVGVLPFKIVHQVELPCCRTNMWLREPWYHPGEDREMEDANDSQSGNEMEVSDGGDEENSDSEADEEDEPDYYWRKFYDQNRRREPIQVQTILPDVPEDDDDDGPQQPPDDANNNTPTIQTSTNDRPRPIVGPLLTKKQTDKKEKIPKSACSFEQYYYAEFSVDAEKRDSHQDKDEEQFWRIFGKVKSLLRKDEAVSVEQAVKRVLEKEEKKAKQQQPSTSSSKPVEAELVEPEEEVNLGPILCFNCHLYIHPRMYAKHIFDHLWQTLAGPKGDERYNVCNHCLRNFDTDQDLREHLFVVNRITPHGCLICQKNFQNERDRLDHMELNHMRWSMNYNCQLCPYRSSTFFQFMHHYDENHNQPICHICLEVFRGADRLLQCSRLSPAERQARNYDLYSDILIHYQLHVAAGDKYACNKCSLNFCNAPDYVVHQKIAHTNLKMNYVRQDAHLKRFARADFWASAKEMENALLYENEAAIRESLGPPVPEVVVPSKVKKAARFSHDVPHVLVTNASPSADESMDTDSTDGPRPPPPEVVTIDSSSSDSEDDDLLPTATITTVPVVAPVVTRKNSKAEQSNSIAARQYDDLHFLANCTAGFGKDGQVLDGNEFMKNQTCFECLLPVTEPGINTGHETHFSRQLLSCPSDGCHYSTFCYEAYADHCFAFGEQHKPVVEPSSGVENSEPRLADVVVCLHCFEHFDTNEDLLRHLVYCKHVAFTHIYKDDDEDNQAGGVAEPQPSTSQLPPST